MDGYKKRFNGCLTPPKPKQRKDLSERVGGNICSMIPKIPPLYSNGQLVKATQFTPATENTRVFE